MVDGVAAETHFAAIPGTPLYHLLMGGDSWTVAAQPLEGVGRWALGAVGERWEVEVVDDRTWQIQALIGRRAGGGHGGVVKAPMPGLVVRIEVAPGQRVAPGAGLVVVEAMKMENELRAAGAGVVTGVHVEVGQAVEKGAPLVTVEAVEATEPLG
ncbi:MAG: acetyl-CoA carboxylase biotin carboxyl carrier protein subunit [Gemmatimonadetes bacterium]|nr:acetyl-CoA carboxylase biotin carboxyl carrier protein subunit [Gemmatimonadota bacterium]